MEQQESNDTETNESMDTKLAEEERNAAALRQSLEAETCLYELHTHLLGMGNASFWVHNILTDPIKLPTQNDFTKYDHLRLQLGPLVWNNTTKAFIDREKTKAFFDDLRSDTNFTALTNHEHPPELLNLVPEKLIIKLKNQDLSFKKNFSYDVVLSLENLSKGLGIKQDQPKTLIQAIAEEKLGVYTRSDWKIDHFFKEWIIFNARIQEIEIVYGMQVGDLRILIGGAKSINEITDPAQRDARAHIMNAFSMMNTDGSEPRSVDFHSFRGAFTPEFYPRRFSLKDSLYSQRLDLLAFLLRNALYRYSTCSPMVKYCEFSVGCGDLSRPWVFDVLLTFSVREEVGKLKELVENGHFPWLKTNGFERNIEYRFLAGFNRHLLDLHNAYSTSEAVTFLYETPQYAIHVMLREFYRSANQRSTIIFTKQVKQLQEMKMAENESKVFFDWVVGLDLFGDEFGYPYCPFVAYEFLKFVEYAMSKNNSFGIRIHCAENVPFVRPELPGYRLFVAHMYIVFHCLDFLKQNLKCNIRVGHGIAFDRLLSVENYKIRKSSVLVAEMRTYAKSILSSIPFEVNMTSNFYLLGDAIRNVGKDKPLSQLHNNDIPLTLSTDDDGVWPIDKCLLEHQEHHSLAAEYCRAITTRFITQEGDLQKMLKNAKEYRFDKRKYASEERSWNSSEIPNIDKNDYFPTDIIIHPDVLCGLFHRLKGRSIDLFPCVKYYKKRYKLENTSNSEDNDKNCEQTCKFVEQIVVAWYYIVRGLSVEEFKSEYEKLFEDKNLFEKIYRACEFVNSQLMNDIANPFVCVKMMIDKETYVFCSEISNNDKYAQHFLLNTIKKCILMDSLPITVCSFIPSIDLSNRKTIEKLEKIDQHIREANIKVFIHTHIDKGEKLPFMESGKLIITNNHEQYKDQKWEHIQYLLYAICPHGSLVTSVLHFIAKHISNELFYIKTPHVSFRSLIIPFLPLKLGYYCSPKPNNDQVLRENFIDHYSIKNTDLERKIQVEYRLSCRVLYESKYNILCTDVKHEAQIATKDLIQKICVDDIEFLNILKIFCDSIRDFNLLPISFVIIDKFSEYEDYKQEYRTFDNIAVPIIPLKEKLLVCSSVDLFKSQSKNPAYILWFLVTNWDPQFRSGTNPNEYSSSKWIERVIKVGREQLNKKFNTNDTWEEFLEKFLVDSKERKWFWYTIINWCDVIAIALRDENDRNIFANFLKRKDEQGLFKKLLEDSDRHKIGNVWQQDIIKKHEANEYLISIRSLLENISQSSN